MNQTPEPPSTAEFRPFVDTGIYSLPATRYHADPCPQPSLSNSIANILISQSPLHAWHAHSRLNPNYQPETDSRFDLGSAAHMLLLERDLTKIAVVAADDWRTKVAKEARDVARSNGQFSVLARHYASMVQMVAAARTFIASTELAGILDTGLPEQTVIWQEGSAWCRARPDLLSAAHKVILDYKTTENAEPEAFIRQIGRMGYDLQAEWYTRGLAAFGPEPTFVFLAQEISAPYACSLVGLANSYRAVGQSKVERALGLWKRCTETNTWPSYSTRICYAEPRPYELVEIDTPKLTEEESE